MDTREDDIPSMMTVTFLQFIAGVLLFVALLNGEQGLALLFLCLLAVMSGARLWSRASYGSLALSASVDGSRLFPGDRTTFDIRAQNHSWLPVWLNIDVSADGPLQPVDTDGSGTLPSRECSLLWYQQAHFEWEVTARRRGVYQIGATKIRTGDLFGFCPRDQHVQETLQIFVYPRLVPLAPFALSRMDIQGMPGTVHPIKDPVYLLGTREYQHSQPARHIHWKASARANGLQEKLFESTSQERVLLLLDVEQYVGDQAMVQFEQTIEVLASLGLRLLEQGRMVGFVTNGRMAAGGAQVLPLSHNRHQARVLLETLAQVCMDSTGQLSTTLTSDVNFLRNLSCVHFSCRCAEATLAVNRRIRQRYLPVIFVVCESGSDQAGALSIDTGTRQYRLEDLRIS